MNNGEKAILAPGSSNMKEISSAAHRGRVGETMRAMTEEVTIIEFRNSTGNARVRDKVGKVFYCNPNDLRPWYEDYFKAI